MRILSTRAGSRAPWVEQVREGLTLDELHDDEEGLVLHLAEVVEVDGVRVLQLDHRRRFAVEARHDLRVAAELRVQGLDRDLAGRRSHLLLSGVDLPHAALADHAQDAVAALEDLPDEGITAVP